MSEDSPPVPGGFAAGARIAGYLLEEQIGQGGMAVVFRALDERLDRRVALKILAPALAADEAFRQRFIRESRAAAAADHPHIIPVFEAGEASGVLFIAMRFVRGGDVRSLLTSHGALTPDRAAEIVSQVASALDAAHGHGLVHRDVKPANMLLDAVDGSDRPDHVYLSDFGVSKTSLQATGLTGTGQFLGTLDYIAPEQIEGKQVDGRADEYALACAAYELLSGAPPFSKREAVALMYAHMTDTPPPITGLQPALAAAADQVLAKALAKEPGNRYPNCREFAAALRRALGLGARESDPEGVVPGFTRLGGGWAEPAAATRGAATQLPGAMPVEHQVGSAAVGGAVAGGAVAGGAAAGGATAGGAAAAGVTAAPGQDWARSGVPELVTESANIPPRPITSPGPGAAGQVGGPAAAGDRGVTPRLGADHYQGGMPYGGAVGYQGPAGPPAPQRGRGQTVAVIGGVCVIAVAIVIAAVILARSLGAKSHLASGSTTPAGVSSSTPASGGTPSQGAPAATGSPGTASQTPASAAGYRLVRTLSSGSSRGLTSVTWNAGSTLFAASSKDGSTYVWNIATGQLHGQPLALPGAGQTFAAAISQDGTEVAAGYSDASTYLFNVATGRVIATLHDPGGGEVNSVAFSPDGRTLATADSDGAAYLWHIGTGSRRPRPAAILTDPYGHGVWSATFSSSGTLATGDYYGNVTVWDIGSGSSAATFSMPGSGSYDPVTALAFSTDGSVLAAGDNDGDAYLWNVGSGQRHLFESTPGNPIWGFSFSGSDSMAMADNNGYTYLWHVSAGSVAATSASALLDPSHGSQGVGALAFSGDGKWLVTGDTNGNAYVWKVG